MAYGIYCPYCLSEAIIKKARLSGKIDDNGEELSRFKCKSCAKNFSPFDRRFYSKYVVRIVNTLVELRKLPWEIAEITGISQASISKMVSGKYPDNGIRDVRLPAGGLEIGQIPLPSIITRHDGMHIDYGDFEVIVRRKSG
ncbi:hypothetical protein LJR245_007504 [Rhizobium leguminosarum]|uniref:hypothetical protein n=1 Tax=Rhizobium leguminosarum TaxID=384 RepID=UPI003ECDFD73